jgi:hypothetical protein
LLTCTSDKKKKFNILSINSVWPNCFVLFWYHTRRKNLGPCNSFLLPRKTKNKQVLRPRILFVYPYIA